MGAAKPALGYPSRSAAITALRGAGRTTASIAATLGISPKKVSDLEYSARRDRTDERSRPPGRKRRLSDTQIDEMAMLRERGWSCERIAERFTAAGTPISGSAVYWQCMRVGAEPPVRLRGGSHPTARPYSRNGHIVQPWTADDDARMLALEAAGVPILQIAERMGRANSSVRGRLMTLARNQARAEEAA